MTATEQIPRASSDEQARLDDLYPAFAAAHLAPLWLQREGLMPAAPQPDAQPALWRWSTLLPLAERSGALVPVGRGGERRAIALATPGGLDAFRLSDEPVFAALNLVRTARESVSR
jgi:gentisate 1,2-dioxygenase